MTDADSIRAEARERGVAPSTIQRRRRRSDPDPEDGTITVEWVEGLDGKIRPNRRFDTRPRDRTIRRMKKKGATIREIAAAVDCSVGTVHRVLKKEGQ